MDNYDDNIRNTIIMPQHLINSTRTMEESHCNSKKSRKRRRPSSSSLIAIPCLLLSAAMPDNNICHGYTTSKSPYTKTPTSNKSLLTKAREIREIKNTNGPDLLTATDDILPSSPNFDNNALSAALFDDDFTTSLENSILNLQSATKPNDITASVSNLSSKAKAEEFDRFMEEDSNVASLIYDEIKPGSLVNGVKESRGSDVVDNMEVKLQKEAYNRRRMRRESLKNKLASRNNGEEVDAAPTAKVTRRKAAKLHTKKKTSKSSLLTKEQEYALANTIQAGTKLHKLKAEYESKHTKPLSKKQWANLASMSPNDLRKLISDYRSAKQELVSSNLGLVHAVVKNYSSKANYRGVHLDELVQEGSLGLIRAAELFDPAKNLRFSTYATIWIKGVLSNSNSLDDMITLPSREKTLSNKVRTAWEEIDGGGKGTKPNISASNEIAQRLQMKESVVKTHLQRMARASNILSLDYQYNVGSRSGTTNDRQESLHNNIQLGTDADLAEQLQFKADIVSELTSNLSEKEVQLMRLRYGLCNDEKEHTVKECAAIMGVSRETARQLQHKCLKKLREASSMESLQEYLLTVA